MRVASTVWKFFFETAEEQREALGTAVQFRDGLFETANEKAKRNERIPNAGAASKASLFEPQGILTRVFPFPDVYAGPCRVP